MAEQFFNKPSRMKAQSICRFLLLIPFTLWSLGVCADPQGPSSQPLTAAEITEDVQRINLTPYLGLFEDTSAKLTIEQVSSEAEFQPVGEGSSNFGFTTSAWWAKFSLHNPMATPQHLVIRQDYPLIDFFDVWYKPQADQNWQHIATGDRRPFHQRPYNNRTFLIPLTLDPGETVDVYVRLSTQGSMNIGLFVHSDEDMVKFIAGEYLALGIYYGGFLVLIVYNLIMSFGVREKAFAHYLLYVASYGLYMSVHNGISFQYLWPDNVWLANKNLLIFLALSLFWALRFTRTILTTETLIPRSDTIARVLEYLSIVCLLASPFIAYGAMIIPIAILTMIISAHCMVMAVQTVLRGSMPARYYLTAFTALLLSVIAYILKTFGWIPHNFWTQNAFQVGSLIEMVLLSIAIASRLSEIKQQTFVDTLTQLYNRRYMNDQLNQEMQKALRTGQPLSVAVIDIDHFKHFNDTQGHAEGDKALQAVAKILKETVRKPCTPCRFGGEEFVLILPNTSTAQAHILAERVRQQIQQHTADSLGLTVSIGYASTEQGGFHRELELFEAADFALYQAKGNGRNQVVHFVPEDDRRHGFTASQQPQ